jgi:hypothetical protein
MVSTYFTGGADFGEGEDEQNITQTVGQIIVVYVMAIVMMNLLVGILSEELSKIIESKTVSNYKLLLGLCIENETLTKHPLGMLVKYYFIVDKDEVEDGHLVFANSMDDSEQWEGSVNYTKKVITDEASHIS